MDWFFFIGESASISPFSCGGCFAIPILSGSDFFESPVSFVLFLHNLLKSGVGLHEVQLAAYNG